MVWSGIEILLFLEISPAPGDPDLQPQVSISGLDGANSCCSSPSGSGSLTPQEVLNWHPGAVQGLSRGASAEQALDAHSGWLGRLESQALHTPGQRLGISRESGSQSLSSLSLKD